MHILSLTGDPHNDPNAQGDAFKTLFVARVVSFHFVFSFFSGGAGVVGKMLLEWWY